MKCHKSLMRGKDTATVPPSKFSIANGFAIGDLPEHLNDVSLTECRPTALATFKGHTVIARGGKHKSIKSHILVFSSNPESISKGLNTLLENDEKLLVIFTNPMTSVQKKVVMRRYDARKTKINALFKLYCDDNVLYKHLRDESENTQQDHSLLNATQETVSDMLIVHTFEDPQAAVDVAGDKDNRRRPKILEEAEKESEDLEVHQDASLFTTKDSVHATTSY